MKILALTGNSDRDMINKAKTYALEKCGTNDLSRLDVRHEIGNFMYEFCRGRPSPERLSRVTPNLEGQKMLRGDKLNTYPKHVKTDKQKYDYLVEQYYNSCIDEEVLSDLVSVLNVKKFNILDIMCKKVDRKLTADIMRELK